MIIEPVTLPRCACGAPGVIFDPGRLEQRAPGGILIGAGAPITGRCLACAGFPTNTEKDTHVIDRVRPAPRPGDNVTDETRLSAIASLTASTKLVSDAAEELKAVRADHSANLKHWKKLGIRLKPIKKVIADRFEDQAEVLADLHEETRLRALTNMPNIQTDLSAMWAPINVDADAKAEADRFRRRDAGAFAAREGQPRDANIYTAGSAEYADWDKGWLEDQDRIARAMKDGKAPIVDTSRGKPPRKKAAAPATPKAAASSARRRPRNGAGAHA